MRRVPILLLVAAMLSGCGLKGPLYMPGEKPPPRQSTKPTPTSATTPASTPASPTNQDKTP